jgi:hypothetical protein
MRPNTFFCQKLCTTYFGSKVWAISAAFEGLPKEKQSPNVREFAQSGHPATEPCFPDLEAVST